MPAKKPKDCWAELLWTKPPDKNSTRSSNQDLAENLTRSFCKNLFRASHKSSHTSTSNAGHLQELHSRAIDRISPLHKIFSQGAIQNPGQETSMSTAQWERSGTHKVMRRLHDMRMSKAPQPKPSDAHKATRVFHKRYGHKHRATRAIPHLLEFYHVLGAAI